MCLFVCLIVLAAAQLITQLVVLSANLILYTLFMPGPCFLDCVIVGVAGCV